MAGSIVETSEELFNEVSQINLTGAFLTIKSALSLLRSGASIILNVINRRVDRCAGGAEYYAASTGGYAFDARAGDRAFATRNSH